MGIVKWNGAATKAFEPGRIGSVGYAHRDSAAGRVSARERVVAKAFAKGRTSVSGADRGADPKVGPEEPDKESRCW